MAASKQLVFIPEINKTTWLLMTKREDGACLRDYSVQPCREDRTRSVTDLEKLLGKDGSYFEKLPAFSKIPFGEHDFWKQQVELRNAELGLPTNVNRQRLQNEFKNECQPCWGNQRALQATFERWISRFKHVKDKVQFNHWDNDSSESKYPATKGIGWTSQLLEASRRGGKLRLIQTGSDETDFSLVAMEVGFSISSKDNPFGEGKDIIIPDGIGLRKNGYFTVVEVKGPQDERDLVEPLVQATCAALAVVAKTNMLQRIAKASGKLRPASKCAEVPKQRRSLGIHVIMQAAKTGGPRVKWTEQVEQRCAEIINVFGQLKYIAYSFVSEKQANNLVSLPTDYLITTDGVIKTR